MYEQVVFVDLDPLGNGIAKSGPRTSRSSGLSAYTIQRLLKIPDCLEALLMNGFGFKAPRVRKLVSSPNRDPVWTKTTPRILLFGNPQTC